MKIIKTIGKVILVGFLAKMFGCGKGDGRFVSEKGFQKNMAKQVSMSPQTLMQLREYKVTDQTKLKLEYFFYTDTADKAAVLVAVLTEKGYTAEHGPSAGRDKTFVVTGWTTSMLMDESTVVEWTRQMCQAGYKYDCDFDGWGTNPKQD